MPCEVFAVADGRFDTYRRGGYEFHVTRPTVLADDAVTDEIRNDPWLIVREVGAATPDADAGQVEQFAEQLQLAKTALADLTAKNAQLQTDQAELQTLYHQALEQLEAANTRLQALEVEPAALPAAPPADLAAEKNPPAGK